VYSALPYLKKKKRKEKKRVFKGKKKRRSFPSLVDRNGIYISRRRRRRDRQRFFA